MHIMLYLFIILYYVDICLKFNMYLNCIKRVPDTIINDYADNDVHIYKDCAIFTIIESQ